MPEQERVASRKDLRAIFVTEEGQVVGNLANDGIPNELADLGGRHSDLSKLTGAGTTFSRLDETLEDTRIRDGRERHRDGVGQLLCDLVEVTNPYQLGSEREKEERRTYSWAARYGA